MIMPSRMPKHWTRKRNCSPNDLQLRGLQKGLEVESGSGEETIEEAGAVLHPPDRGPHQRGELADVAFGQVSQGSFQA
jgi:hypothetical protein